MGLQHPDHQFKSGCRLSYESPRNLEKSRVLGLLCALGGRTWLLAKLPQRYIISGDEVTPYLVFMNSHDGTGAIKAAMTPIRQSARTL